jgi:pyrroline-5-carboxylate reductase
MLSQTVGFVGAGQMARAMARGFVAAGLLAEQQIVAADPQQAAIDNFHHRLPGAAIARNNAEVVERSQIVVLAVKPQTAQRAFLEMRDAMTAEKLVLSIITGIRLDALGKALGAGRLVRVVPNTPCLVGQSATAFCLGPGTSSADGELVAKLLGSLGLAILIEEKLLNAVTGLSGSGPAYIYLMIEALADGGVRMGLPRETALRLAAQTVKGAAEMVLTSGEHTAVLKDRVASPGGTTMAGLHVLETQSVRGALISAVEAATLRAAQLAGEG